jgi:hypothetical protein
MTLSFSSEVNGTTVLEISHPRVLGTHPSLATHGKIGLTVKFVFFEGMGGCFFCPGVARDDRFSFEILDDETQDILRIIRGVPPDGFYLEGERFFGFLEHGDGLMDFTDVSRVSDLPQREFLLSIDQDVIPISPEVSDFFFEGVREMDQDAQSSIPVPFGPSGLIEAVGDRGLEVVLSYLGHNGTGVQDEVLAPDNLLVQQCLDQPGMNALENRVGGLSEKLGEPFDGRRGSIEIKP